MSVGLYEIHFVQGRWRGLLQSGDESPDSTPGEMATLLKADTDNCAALIKGQNSCLIK